jgi:hypothetical protein
VRDLHRFASEVGNEGAKIFPWPALGLSQIKSPITLVVFKRELNDLLGTVFEEIIALKRIVKEKNELTEKIKEETKKIKEYTEFLKEIDSIFIASVKMGVNAKLSPETIAAELGCDISLVKPLYDELTRNSSKLIILDD